MLGVFNLCVEKQMMGKGYISQKQFTFQ
jgi:hypothetical protein